MGYTVRAGIETGVYYLILAGISFSATWKDFKDHARSHQLEVDYVEIYADKHGGWVRLLGHENFQKACKIFNGAHIKDHAIQVHTQNEQHPVVLRYPPPSSHQPPHQPPIMIQHSQPLPQIPSPQGSFSYSTTPYTPSSPVMDAYYTHVSYPTSDTIPRPVNIGHPGSFPTHVPLLNHTQYTYNSPEPPSYYPPAPEHFTVRTEFRKIVIKGLPDSMTTNDVYKLIEWALEGRPGYEPTWIEEITLPTSKSGKSRRHACVLLQSFPVADHVKTCLDGMTYEGKKLSVEFAKEGATLSSGQNVTASKERLSSKKSDKKSERKPHSSCSKEAERPNRDSALETHHRPRTPAVVDGSGGRSKHK